MNMHINSRFFGTELTRCSRAVLDGFGGGGRLASMTRPSPTLALIVGAIVAALAAAWTSPVRVVDGDTIRWAFVTWRLAGFDAPGVRPHARCEAEHLAGVAARERLRALVRGGGARLVYEGRLERWRRPLAHLSIGGEDVSAIAIREGWGHAYDGHGPRGWCPSVGAVQSSVSWR